MSRQSLDTAIRLSAEVKGGGAIDAVKRSLQDLNKSGQVSTRELKALGDATLRFTRTSSGTVSGIRNSITALRGLQEQARIGSAQFRRYSEEIGRLEQRLRSLDSAGSRNAALAGLIGGVAGGLTVAAADAARQAAGGAIAVGLDAESARVRLRALTEEFGEYNQAQAAAERIARTLRITNTEAEASFASLYASLRPTGVTIEELEKVFVGFNAAARNSGATAQESAAAMIQLRQALAAGVLNGENLASIREQAPLVAQAVAKEMGVTIGELKDLGAEGKVTTDIVLRALKTLNDTQLDKLQEQFNTGRQAIKDFQVAATDLGIEISRIFGPSAVRLLRDFTAQLSDAANVMGALSGNARSLQSINLQRQASQMASAEANQRFGWFTFDQGGKSDFFQRRQREILSQLQANQPGGATDSPNASQLEAQRAAAAERASAAQRAAAEGTEKAAKAAKKAQDDAARAARQYQQDQLRAQARFASEQLRINQQLQRNAIELDNLRYKNRESLAEREFDFLGELQQRTINLWSDGLLGPARAAAQILAQFMTGFSEGQSRVAQAKRAVDEARRALEQAQTVHQQTLVNMREQQRIDGIEAQAAAMGPAVPAGGGVSAGGIVARTGNTGQSTGPHLDARWADGRRITAADVDRYLRVNGQAPSSFGVTSQYGPRNLFGRSFHAGVDLGTPSGSAISLTNGARMLRNMGNTGAGGYAIEIMTAEGPMRLLHLQAGSAARPSAAAPAAPVLPRSQQFDGPGGAVPLSVVSVRDAAGEGDIQQAQETLKQREEELKLVKSQNDQLRKLDRVELTNKLTDSLREQNYELKTGQEDMQLRNRLLMEGVREEVIEGELAKAKLYREQKLVIDGLKEGIDAIKDPDDRKAAEESLERMNVLYAEQAELIDRGVRAQLEQGQALRLYIGELKRSLNEMRNMEQVTINLAQTVESEMSAAISNSVSAIVTGNESVTQSIGNMFKNVGQAFVKMAADIIAKQMVMVVLQSILRALGGPSFSGGGGSGGGVFNVPELAPGPAGTGLLPSAAAFANGGVMSPRGPMPLRTYSRGGVASSPQVAVFGEGMMNEAFVPLPDGRRIPVAMEVKDSGGRDRMRELMGPAPTGSASPVLNMTFETTTINGVEYVSQEQLEAAMQETRKRAASDGAKRGMSMTLDRLQQSPSTRSRVGIAR